MEHLGHLWLHELRAADLEKIAPELRSIVPSRDDALQELAVAYADLFLLNVFPYGSAFTDPDAELNSASSNLASLAFDECAFHPAELAEVAAPDHLGLCLLLIDSKGNDRRGAQSAYARMKREFEFWAPACCVAVEREPGVHPFYRVLAERTRGEVLRQAESWANGNTVVSSDAGASHSSADDEDFEEAETRLSDVLRFFLAPARCGIFLSRARLGHLALRLGDGIRLPFATRYEVARNLFEVAGESDLVTPLLDLLAVEVREWSDAYIAMSTQYPAWSDAASNWLGLTGTTTRWLEKLRKESLRP